MKTIFLLFIFTLSLGVSDVFSQNIQGIATYKSQRKMDIQLDSTMNDGMKEQIMAMLKKQSERTYFLEFTNDESQYKQEVKLDDDSVIEGGGMKLVIAGNGGGNDVLYKNLKENRYADQVEIFGKEFLIKDALENRDWVMGKETKNIGEYTCFKATYTTTRTVMVAESSSDGENKEVTSQEEVTLTAWYTPQIPVKNGPANYDGLPGLILEVNDGSETILCSKIVLNPEKGLAIKEPTKGKVVTATEYEEIMEKKMKEMNEQFEGDGRREGGNQMRIRIGG
ncbi:GLPGLI family protein [Aureisphaera sp. CAU 1614]|uniref:GLPGLI family protein n=1 Tax=Halomarinibacterium sedimenti TaxID=2857106 RepID=A0A9X1K137_9FLAO|nr:GLPGLI family protein [Halomarinibacterium sedimenti]MBW2939091.1 GLPGLI family protein [Halomarinibacterium sedimenti]